MHQSFETWSLCIRLVYPPLNRPPRPHWCQHLFKDFLLYTDWTLSCQMKWLLKSKGKQGARGKSTNFIWSKLGQHTHNTHTRRTMYEDTEKIRIFSGVYCIVLNLTTWNWPIRLRTPPSHTHTHTHTHACTHARTHISETYNKVTILVPRAFALLAVLCAHAFLTKPAKRSGEENVWW